MFLILFVIAFVDEKDHLENMSAPNKKRRFDDLIRMANQVAPLVQQGRYMFNQVRNRNPPRRRNEYIQGPRRRYYGKFSKRGAYGRKMHKKNRKKWKRKMKKRALTPYKALMGLRGTVAPLIYHREKHIEYTGSVNR